MSEIIDSTAAHEPFMVSSLIYPVVTIADDGAWSAHWPTILGPLWFFIQPLLTTLTFTVLFGNVAKLDTDGLPKVLFYLSGVTAWNYFSECLMKTSETFTPISAAFRFAMSRCNCAWPL